MNEGFSAAEEIFGAITGLQAKESSDGASSAVAVLIRALGHGACLAVARRLRLQSGVGAEIILRRAESIIHFGFSFLCG